MNPIVI